MPISQVMLAVVPDLKFEIIIVPKLKSLRHCSDSEIRADLGPDSRNGRDKD